MLKSAVGTTRLGLVLAACGTLVSSVSAQTLYGPKPYVSANDSPFVDKAFGYFHLETFESHRLEVPAGKRYPYSMRGAGGHGLAARGSNKRNRGTTAETGTPRRVALLDAHRDDLRNRNPTGRGVRDAVPEAGCHKGIQHFGRRHHGEGRHVWRPSVLRR